MEQRNVEHFCIRADKEGNFVHVIIKIMSRNHIIITASIVTILLVLLLALGLNYYFKHSAEQAIKFYAQGLEFANRGDLQNAYYNFRKIPFNSNLKTLAIYKQAWCAKSANDKKTAIRKYKKYIKRVNDNVMAPVGYWELGLLQLETDNRKEAFETFNRLIKKYPDSDYGMAANYQLGALLAVQNPKASNDYFYSYLKYAPLGRFAKESISFVENSSIDLTDEQKYVLAVALYENNFYTKSINWLKNIPFSLGWYYLGKNYEALKDNNTARQYYMEGLLQVKNEDEVSHIIDALEGYVRLSEQPKREAWRTLALFLKDTDSAAYPGALFNFSKYLSQADAMSNYQKIYKDYRNSHWASESLWEVFWIKYKKRDIKTALELAKTHIGGYENTNASPKILFWYGKILERSKKTDEADKLYKRVLNNFPDSYYAFRANEQLNRNKKPFRTIKNLKVKNDTIPPVFPYKNGSKTMDYLNKLAELNDGQTIEDFKINDDFVKSWIYANNGNYSQAVLTAREAMSKINHRPSNKDPRWKLVYPVYFSKEINFSAKKNNISPYLTLAIIREESYFNTNAVSHVGAQGLMQLMPDTARYVGGESYNPAKINDPTYNIFLGAKYFAIALSDLNNNEMLAVLGYNSGPTSVKCWINSVEHNDPDEFIEDVPYDETRNYVKKIYATYWNYLRIYEG